MLSDLRGLDVPVVARGTQLTIDAAALQVDTTEFDAMAHRGEVKSLKSAAAPYALRIMALIEFLLGVQCLAATLRPM